MGNRVHFPPNLVYSPGTQVVALRDVPTTGGRPAHPRGAVGVVVRAPGEGESQYRVRFLDGLEAELAAREIMLLAKFKEDQSGGLEAAARHCNLYERVIYRCVVGSRAFGLDCDESDTDRRGIYVPPANLHWSIYGAPEQLENQETDEVYWEIQKFLTLALKANPNILECLFTHLVEIATPLAEELLAMRSAFLSQLVYQTYNGYAASQFKRMHAHKRNRGKVKWKHVMHLLRLLISGTTVLREGVVRVEVTEHRDMLLAVRRGEVPWAEVDRWRLELQAQFDRALATTALPERPDYEKANDYLLKVRRWAVEVNDDRIA